MNDIFIYHHYIMSKILHEADEYETKATSDLTTDMAVKFTGKEILSPNELRQIIGLEKMEELI